MKKHYAIGMADGSVTILETPVYAVVLDKQQPVLVRWADGEATIFDGEAWAPIPEKNGGFVMATPEECIAKWADPAMRAAVVSIREIDRSELPQDRTFRNAWKPDLTVDMDKARAIHRDRLREARRPLLAALDVAYQRADERSDQAAKLAVVARKQTLRDVTADPRIAAARTPDDLKAALR